MFGLRRPNEATSGPSRRVPAMGCFGKLPMHTEFIRHNLAWREGRALDQWFQDAMVSAARRRERFEIEAPARVHHGVFTGTGDERTILFSARPSTDSSGRRYPFVIFRLPGDPDPATDPQSLPATMAAFSQATTPLMTQQWPGESVSEVLAEVDRLGTEAPPAEYELPNHEPDQLLTELYADYAPVTPLAHLQRCVQLLREAGRRPTPSVGWGLRLPVGTATLETAAGWWLALADRVLEQPGWRPCLISMPAQAERSGGDELLLFFRQPPAEVAASLLRGELGVDAISNPAERLSPAPESPGVPEGVTSPSRLINWLLET